MVERPDAKKFSNVELIQKKSEFFFYFGYHICF